MHVAVGTVVALTDDTGVISHSCVSTSYASLIFVILDASPYFAPAPHALFHFFSLSRPRLSAAACCAPLSLSPFLLLSGFCPFTVPCVPLLTIPVPSSRLLGDLCQHEQSQQACPQAAFSRGRAFG